MQGAALFDRHARHIWSSWEHPQLAGKVVGTPMWEFVALDDLPIVHEAICRVLHDGEPVRYSVRGGPPDDLRDFQCELRPLENVGFLAVFRERPRLLSARERDVLLALCNDEPPKATARRLGISVKTVESFRGILRRKTGAKGLGGLVRWAIKNAFIDP